MYAQGNRRAHSSFFLYGCNLVDALHQPGKGSERDQVISVLAALVPSSGDKMRC